MDRMQQIRKIVFVWSVLLVTPLFSQKGNFFECENYRIGARYTSEQLRIRLKIIEQDFQVYSEYGYFEKSLKFLSDYLKNYGVSFSKRRKIMREIEAMPYWSKDKLMEYKHKEINNSEVLFLYNLDLANITSMEVATSIFSLNAIFEKYLSEKQAKEVIEKLLISTYSKNCAVDFLEKNFCVYQKMGLIDEKHENFHQFLKEKLK